MSSGDQGTKKSSIEEYEKDYLARLEKEKKSGNLQDVIVQMTQEIKKHETKDYIGFCAFCTMGVSREEMVYKNNLLFHPNCFEQQGKNFPQVNEELQKQTTNTKVQLVLLKNLKERTSGISNVPSSHSRPKPKKRSIPKRKTKKKSKAKRKRHGRRNGKRKSKKRPAKRRRKSKRTSRRRPVRRSSKPKTRRRIKRSSSRRRRR
jgi:hypothetical protein